MRGAGGPHKVAERVASARRETTSCMAALLRASSCARQQLPHTPVTLLKDVASTATAISASPSRPTNATAISPSMNMANCEMATGAARAIILQQGEEARGGDGHERGRAGSGSLTAWGENICGAAAWLQARLHMQARWQAHLPASCL